MTWEWERVVSGGGQAEREQGNEFATELGGILRNLFKKPYYSSSSLFTISSASSNSLTITVQFPAIRTVYMWTRDIYVKSTRDIYVCMYERDYTNVMTSL